MLRIISKFCSKKLYGMMVFQINKSQMFKLIIMPFSDQKMKKVLSQESKQKQKIPLQANIPNQTTDANASNPQQVKPLKSKSQNTSNSSQNTSQSQQKNKPQTNSSSSSQNPNPRAQSKQNHQKNSNSSAQSKQNHQKNPNPQSQSKQKNQQKKSNSEDSNKTDKPKSDKKQQFKSDNKQSKFYKWLFFSSIGLVLIAMPGAFYYLDLLNCRQYYYVTFCRQKQTIESLSKKILTQKIIDRECLDEQLKDPKTNIIYDPNQIFYPTLVSKWAQNFFKNLSKLEEKINVGYGVSGSGKSQGIQRQVNRRRANGEFIYYTHLGEYCGKINDKLGKKDNDNSVALTLDIPERRQITKWLTQSSLYNSKHKTNFLKKYNSKQGVTFILDEFNIVEQSIPKQFQLYQTLMRGLLFFVQNKIKVVLISSSEGFVLSNKKLTAVSGIRKDKFNFVQIQGNYKKDFEQMFKDMKLSKKAIQSILNYHYNFRDMKKSIEVYRNCQGSQQQKLKALQDRLNEQFNNTKKTISNLIYNKENERRYMMQVCNQKIGLYFSGNPKQTLQQENLVNTEKFTKKIVMKAFEEYAKQRMNASKSFKCKSKQYYQD